MADSVPGVRTVPGGALELADDLVISRMGFGAMQLAGPGVFGPPRDRDQALAVLREAVDLGVTHIYTSDFYGPVVVNELIREALHPYPADLRIVTKVGARRGQDGSWRPSLAPADLKAQVRENLAHLGVVALDVVNLRLMFDVHGPAEGSIEAPLTVLAELQRKGLIRRIGLSNATPRQLADGRRITDIVCVQNQYNLAQRGDDALIDDLANSGIAYVPFFPLGGFSPLHSDVLESVATRLGAPPRAVAASWLLQHSPNVMLISGSSSVDHLRENIDGAALVLPPDAVAELDAI